MTRQFTAYVKDLHLWWVCLAIDDRLLCGRALLATKVNVWQSRFDVFLTTSEYHLSNFAKLKSNWLIVHVDVKHGIDAHLKSRDYMIYMIWKQPWKQPWNQDRNHRIVIDLTHALAQLSKS